MKLMALFSVTGFRSCNGKKEQPLREQICGFTYIFNIMKTLYEEIKEWHYKEWVLTGLD